MNTLFDIGDKIDITLKGEVIEYSASRNGDCYTIAIKCDDKKNQYTRIYMDTDTLRQANASVCMHKMKIDV